MPPQKASPRDPHSIESLKKQVTDLQEKLSELEDTAPDSVEVKELFSWVSPERVFIAQNKKWFINTALLVLLLVVITLIFKEVLLMGAILAVLFVLYVLATVPPPQIEKRITTQGIIVHDRSYLWAEMSDFWFKEKYDHTLLEIDTYLRFPGQLSLIIDVQDQDAIRDILVKYLPFREVTKKTWVEKSGEWVTKKLSSV